MRKPVQRVEVPRAAPVFQSELRSASERVSHPGPRQPGHGVSGRPNGQAPGRHARSHPRRDTRPSGVPRARVLPGWSSAAPRVGVAEVVQQMLLARSASVQGASLALVHSSLFRQRRSASAGSIAQGRTPPARPVPAGTGRAMSTSSQEKHPTHPIQLAAVAHQMLVAAPCSTLRRSDCLDCRDQLALLLCPDRAHEVGDDRSGVDREGGFRAPLPACRAPGRRAHWRLRLPVGDPLSYGRIRKCGSSSSMAARRWPRELRVTTRAPRSPQRPPEASGELEVAEVVRRQLRLEPPRVAHQRGGHDPRHCSPGHAADERRRKRAAKASIDARVGQIQELQLDAGDPGQSRPCLLRRPCRNDDRRPADRPGTGWSPANPALPTINGAIESLLTDHLARGGLWPVAGGERVLGRRHPQDLATAGSVGDPIGAAIRPPRPGASWRFRGGALGLDPDLLQHPPGGELEAAEMEPGAHLPVGLREPCGLQSSGAEGRNSSSAGR